MPLPISATQLKKLMKRLRDGMETPEDLHALADVRLYYRQVLERAHNDVVRLCAEVQHAEPTAPRVKTLKTTMEKLHRQPEVHSLGQIRDLAGLRVVVDGTRTDQDEIAARIGALLSDGERPARLIDRRKDPRAGYRAVHVEVRREGILIEVQVRTGLQHRWAELFERTADRFGRSLRYGEPTQLEPEASRLLDVLDETSNMINFVEENATSSQLDTDLAALRESILMSLGTAAEYLEELK